MSPLRSGLVVLHVLDLFSVGVFAISGALMAGRKKMDFFGVIVLAIVTGVGGGTLRDLLLGVRPVFWVVNPVSIVVAIGAGFGTMLAARYIERQRTVLLVADAFGLALATALGTQKAMAFGAPAFIAVIMGMMSGTAGGMIRDVLCSEIPLILRKEIYATAALLTGVVFVMAAAGGVSRPLAVAIGIVPGLVLRLAAIRWQLSLPVFAVGEEGSPPQR